MPMYKNEQLTHTPNTDHPEWNESYYFLFSDESQKIRAMTRIGFKPNKDEGMNFFFIFLPDGSALGHNATSSASSYPTKFQVAEMEFARLDDGRWTYHFKGRMVHVSQPELFPKVRTDPTLSKGMVDVQMELTLQPIHDTYEYSQHMTPESLELGKKSGDEHWEQIGQVEGSLRVGDTTYNISGIGERDHTHGLRDWTGIGDWLYYVVWFDETLAINPAAIIDDSGTVSTGGFLFKEGQNIPLRSIHLAEQKLDSNGFPTWSRLEIVDARGEPHTLVAEAGSIVPLPFGSRDGGLSILIQSFGSFELDGRGGGFGSYERLVKLR